ncbi:MAG: hypothetical protein ACKOAP_04340 [Vulcanococcus sp.]
MKPVLDGQGAVAIAVALLLALISFFTSYIHVDIPGFGPVEVPQQLGLPCLVAAVATAVGEAQLASRARDRDRDLAAEERERAAEASQSQIRAAQRADRSTVLLGRLLLDASNTNRRRLDAFLTLLDSEPFA